MSLLPMGSGESVISAGPQRKCFCVSGQGRLSAPNSAASSLSYTTEEQLLFRRIPASIGSGARVPRSIGSSLARRRVCKAGGANPVFGHDDGGLFVKASGGLG